jgi:hypothetical protein
MLPPLVRSSKNAGQTINTAPFPCLLFVRPSDRLVVRQILGLALKDSILLAIIAGERKF